MLSELGHSLSDFGKAAKLLGDCEGNALGKAFSDLGTKSEALSVKLQKEVGFSLNACCCAFPDSPFCLVSSTRLLGYSCM